MSDPFIGEIKIWSFAWAPRGWALCDGSSIAVQQNPALYSLIGNSFGGNTLQFNLPDLRGRTPVGIGANPSEPGVRYTVGQSGGQETVALSEVHAPAHTHGVRATAEVGTQFTPGGNNFAKVQSTNPASPVRFNIYQPHNPGDALPDPQTLDTTSVDAVGGGAHTNMQPYLTLNFAIALSGLYPPRP